MTNDMTVQTSGPALRIGLIGAGKMAVNHLRAIQGSDLARVVGIADPAVDPSVLDGLIPKDAKIFSTAEELLDEIKLDVVHIVTPPTPMWRSRGSRCSRAPTSTLRSRLR